MPSTSKDTWHNHFISLYNNIAYGGVLCYN